MIFDVQNEKMNSMLAYERYRGSTVRPGLALLTVHVPCMEQFRAGSARTTQKGSHFDANEVSK